MHIVANHLLLIGDSLVHVLWWKLSNLEKKKNVVARYGAKVEF